MITMRVLLFLKCSNKIDINYNNKQTKGYKILKVKEYIVYY